MEKITRKSLQKINHNTEYHACTFHVEHRVPNLSGSVFHNCSFRHWAVIINKIFDCRFINCNFSTLLLGVVKNTFFEGGYIQSFKITPDKEYHSLELISNVNIIEFNLSFTFIDYSIVRGYRGSAFIPFHHFPEKIFELSSLQKLNLSRNKIQTIPKNIKKLRNLREFSISSNNLRTLPEEIYKLTSLKSLDMSRNNLDWVLKKKLQRYLLECKVRL
ncbi:leucine-rich repeat domain-containing protein [Candidatus Uabimicrobium sp. HlEnr_7]|uniref:leucine-rich repeat domain-containing protein n=1 Tax=Candidatus Uabimicrobium helgolandensis TaxID=3095367 RepID=UPI003556B713